MSQVGSKFRGMDNLPTFLAAALGGAGILGFVKWVATMSLRGRLHRAIQQNAETLDLVDDEHARQLIRQAVTTDSLRLASLSLARPAPAAGGWIGVLVYAVIVVASAYALGWWSTGWDSRMLEMAVGPLAIAIVALTSLPYIFISTSARRRREQYLLAAFALAETSPAVVTADVRAGRKVIWRRGEYRRSRQARFARTTPDDWSKARRIAVRRTIRRTYTWPWLALH